MKGGAVPEQPIVFRSAPISGMDPGSSKWKCCCFCHVITGTRVLLSIQIAVTLFVAYKCLSGYIYIHDGCPILTLMWILIGTVPPGLVLWGISKTKPSLFIPYLAIGAVRLMVDLVALVMVYFVSSIATYVIERYTMPIQWIERMERNETSEDMRNEVDRDNFTVFMEPEPMRTTSHLYVRHYGFTMCIMVFLTILYCAEVYLYIMVVKGYKYVKAMKRNQQPGVGIHGLEGGRAANYGTGTTDFGRALPPPYTYGGYAQATLNYGAGSETKAPIQDGANGDKKF